MPDSIFDAVNQFFGVKSDKPMSRKRKTQAEMDDDARFRNKFRDGPNDPPRQTQQKDPSSPIKKMKSAARTGLAAKLRDKSKTELKKTGN